MTAAWQKVFTQGIAPSLSTAGLLALREALASDDKRLIQHATTHPAPTQSTLEWPCDAADAIGFCAWQGDHAETVGEVEEFFARVCYEADVRLGELAACRWY